LNLNTTKERLRSDPAASAFVDLIEKNESYLDLADSSVYYKFPIYKDNDNIITAKLILVAPQRGVFVISTTITDDPEDHEAIQAADEELDTVYGQLHARFTKQKSLRRDKKNLSFPLEPMIFAPYLNGVPATKRILSPLSFTLFVMRQCYPKHWEILLQTRQDDPIFREVREKLTAVPGKFMQALDHCEHQLD
jgi:hypothetical protein